MGAHRVAGFVAILAIVAGACVAGFGLFLLLRAQGLARRGRTAIGVVVDNEAESAGRGRIEFRPVVLFRTEAGRDVTVVGTQRRNWSFAAGSELPVRYDPFDPTRAEVGGSRRAGLGYLASGLLFMVLGIAGYLIVRAMTAIAPP